MDISNTTFFRTNRIFENTLGLTLVRHEITFPIATRFIQTSSKLFQSLDRSDPVQAEISRRLWVLRSTILFTLLPFNDPNLKLDLQMKELKLAADSFPETNFMVESLEQFLTEILNYPVNPKQDWLNQRLSTANINNLEPSGILVALSAGKSPGWPLESSNLLKGLIGTMIPIESRRTLKSYIFQNIILPCACNNVSSTLLTELLFSGITSHIEVLLYPGERFVFPNRLMLPDDGLFYKHIQKSAIEREVIIASGQNNNVDDSWINEAFWQGLHGAERESSLGLCPARYILFSDGAGVFLPEDGRVISLPADGIVNSEADLCMLPLENISEGDILVLRTGDSGFLIYDASERIMGKDDSENLLDSATDWKAYLEALLVTHTCEEVVKALYERGISTRVASVSKWVGPEVLGPGDERTFRGLINLLADKKKLHKSGSELTTYADKCWHDLQTIRGLHQKAGNLIRQDLFKALFKRFGNRNSSISVTDRETVHIEGDTNAELLVVRVNSVDTNIAFVPPSRLGKIDELRGNKWLE